jgi:hypothetical protein
MIRFTLPAVAVLGTWAVAWAPGLATHPETHAVWGAMSMTICLVVLLVSILIGIGTAFLGLMFHHERRYRESHPEAEPTTGRRGHGKS